MKSDVNGKSTCQPGQEQYEKFRHGRMKLIQYDYRAHTGELFSTVARTLDVCRERRDEWLDRS